MSDVRYNLRKLDFPFCAREALSRIEHLITGRNVPTTKQLDLAVELMREFIFCESEWRGLRRASGLNPLQELQLLDVLCEYFSGPLNETAKNTIFLSLFGGPEANRRMNFMCKLASMAISASIAPVLLALGTWLQQTGCTSPPSLQLALSLVRDYFILHSTHEAALKLLPQIAPQFVANFMTAVVEIYLKEGPGGTFSPPPRSLLEIITFWVCSNPKLCLSAQMNPAVLPSGGIPMAAVSPLTGLIQWCALAPLYITIPKDSDVDMETNSASPAKKVKTEKQPNTVDSAYLKNENISIAQYELELYGKLHFGVLQSLYEGKKPQGPPTTVSSQHLAQVVPPILLRVDQSHRQGNSSILESSLQTCLERVAQATQVALASGCVYGNVQGLLSVLGSLPENRMLRIIIKHHQQPC